MKENLVPAEEVLNAPSIEETIRGLVAYDGPLRPLLFRIITGSAGGHHVPSQVAEEWGAEAKKIMNIIYKINNIKDRW